MGDVVTQQSCCSLGTEDSVNSSSALTVCGVEGMGRGVINSRLFVLLTAITGGASWSRIGGVLCVGKLVTESGLAQSPLDNNGCFFFFVVVDVVVVVLMGLMGILLIAIVSVIVLLST